MRFAVLIFPGSNCDTDCLHALRDVMHQDAEGVWHERTGVSGFDCVVVPGGFSYGDYLRAGALARLSPVMGSVRGHAEAGGLVLGICNGFQMLCEAGLLPGALQHNAARRFLCRPVHLRVENTETPFTRSAVPGEIWELPVAHAQGSYYADPGTLAELEANGQVVFRYASVDGAVSPGANPNGSVGNVAGICNRAGNVLGMMPHPERAVEALLGGTDGVRLFESLLPAGHRSERAVTSAGQKPAVGAMPRPSARGNRGE